MQRFLAARAPNGDPADGLRIAVLPATHALHVCLFAAARKLVSVQFPCCREPSSGSRGVRLGSMALPPPWLRSVAQAIGGRFRDAPACGREHEYRARRGIRSRLSMYSQSNATSVLRLRAITAPAFGCIRTLWEFARTTGLSLPRARWPCVVDGSIARCAAVERPVGPEPHARPPQGLVHANPRHEGLTGI